MLVNFLRLAQYFEICYSTIGFRRNQVGDALVERCAAELHTWATRWPLCFDALLELRKATKLHLYCSNALCTKCIVGVQFATYIEFRREASTLHYWDNKYTKQTFWSDFGGSVILSQQLVKTTANGVRNGGATCKISVYFFGCEGAKTAVFDVQQT